MSTKERKARTLPHRYSPEYIESQLDGRCSLVRMVRARMKELQADIGGDLSYAQRSMCRRAVFLELQLGELESAMLTERPKASEYTNLANALSATYRLLGVQKKPKVVDARQYMETKYG